jgi:hypothetical protein
MRRRRVAVGIVFAAVLLAPILPGSTLAVAAAAIPSDFNGDGYADLAIGARSDEMRGSVNVLYGGPAGLTAVGDQRAHTIRPGSSIEANARISSGTPSRPATSTPTATRT